MKKSELLNRVLLDPKATRRQFLTQALAAGATMATATSMWSKSALASPKTGGHLKLGIAGGATTNSLDPSLISDTFMILVVYSIRNNLVEIAEDNTLRPALAESWEAGADASVWNFKIRKGVEFHNGKSLTSADVVASLNLHREADTRSIGAPMFSSVSDVTALDSHTVRVKLNGPNADFPYVLSDYWANILPTDASGELDRTSPHGTGAYILEEFEPGRNAILRKNPNSWQEGVGFVESAELIVINDDSARQTALISGEIHAMNRVNLQTAGLLGRNPGVTILNLPGKHNNTMPMRTDIAPFDNIDVRLALKYAINRQEILDKIFGGFGTLGNDHPIAPSFRYYSAEIPQREQDLDKAKYHLKKAGVDSLDIEIHPSDVAWTSGGVDASVLFAEQASKAGINMNVVREPNDGYWTSVWNRKPFFLSNWGPRQTEDGIWTANYAENSPSNDTAWKDPRFNELLLSARAELDESKRAEMYHEMQVLCRDEGGTILPVFTNLVDAHSNQIKNSGNTATSWEMDGGHFIKRWWFT